MCRRVCFRLCRRAARPPLRRRLRQQYIGGRPGGGGGRGAAARWRRRAPVVTAKVAQKDVPVDIAAIGNVEAYATISRPLAGHRPARGTAVPRRRLRQDRASCSSRSIGGRSRPRSSRREANLVRDQALLAQAEAQLARDAANAEYQQLTAERQAQLTPARHHLEGRRRAGARAGRRDRRDRQGRPRGDRERAGAARRAAGARSTTRECQLGYTTIRRRSTAAPATSR